MEEERNWRLERSESGQTGKQPMGPKPSSQPGPPAKPSGHGGWAQGDGESSPTPGAQFQGESSTVMGAYGDYPESPSGPQLKFNGVPVPAQMPHMAQPMPYPQPNVGMSTAISAIEIDTTTWNITDVLCALYDCSCQCERTIACIVNSPEARLRVKQTHMLRDCADICYMTWCFLQRDSRYSLKLLKLCAHVCEACADGCSAQLDLESQRCAATGMRCAAACRSFIAVHS